MSNQQNSIATSETTTSTLFDKTFRDDEGNIVIAQKPNLPIIIGLAATLLSIFVPDGSRLFVGLDALAFGFLFTWAWLELSQGVNYFRRAIGLIALVGLMASRFLG